MFTRSNRFHSLFIQTLNRLQKRFKVVTLTLINHTQKPIRLMKTVVMDTKSYVAMMINIVNQFKPTEVKRSFTNSWKGSLKRSNTAKV